MPLLFGLIGYPLSHSFSETYFKDKFKKEEIKDCVYKNFPIESIDLLPELIRKEKIDGLNITIPYKESVIPFLDQLDPVAEKVGAVNVIKCIHKGNSIRINGYNSDVYGFEQSLKPILESHHTHALILGTGGASKAVHYVLSQIGLSCLYATRKPKAPDQIGYNEINRIVMENYLLIVNTTPVGMYPNVKDCPDIPYDYITPKHLLYDLIYNPDETLFLSKGRKYGACIQSGYQMLVFQAEKSWEIWK